MKATNLTKKILLSGLVAVVATTSSLKAETISIDDAAFVVSGVPTLAVGGILSGRWGQWDSATSQFIQAVQTGNAGYVDLGAPELSITLNQTTPAVYASGSLMAIAIFASNSTDSQTLNWSLTAGGAKQASVVAWAVLTDSSWIAPSFANNANDVPFTLTANTTAVLGTFSYNGGNDLIGLTNGTVAIPEPSSVSLLAFGLAGLVALRVRRKS